MDFSYVLTVNFLLVIAVLSIQGFNLQDRDNSYVNFDEEVKSLVTAWRFKSRYRYETLSWEPGGWLVPESLTPGSSFDSWLVQPCMW